MQEDGLRRRCLKKTQAEMPDFKPTATGGKNYLKQPLISTTRTIKDLVFNWLDFDDYSYWR